jgi:hypothetical protein
MPSTAARPAGSAGPPTPTSSIAHDGQRYPVKFIISLATGAGVHTFSGGQEANGYVTKRGLTVVDL